ncbi:hypothetical protein B0H63DRAFT_191928 [Podospora didyma]|uniref:Mid2 domain-containing protein n=1 Tax=Podospora didyma TaxID=330526 RepID=A0AAE0NR19_9PEZI|nr:hypothetical protein B0H63DRAFT_191928 [Podospora didyma]
MRSLPPMPTVLFAALVGFGSLLQGVRGQSSANATTCFDTWGNEDKGQVPCYSGTTTEGTVNCCNKGDVCLSNGLCLSPGAQNLMTQQGCTDKAWGKPCNKFCPETQQNKDLASQGFNDIVAVPCADSFNGSTNTVQYCCGPDPQACCKSAAWQPIAAGTIIPSQTTAAPTGPTSAANKATNTVTDPKTSTTGPSSTQSVDPNFLLAPPSGPDPVKIGLGVGFGIGIPLFIVFICMGVVLSRKKERTSTSGGRRRKNRPSRNDFRHRQMQSFGAIDTTLGPPSPTESAWQAWGPMSAASSSAWPTAPMPSASANSAAGRYTSGGASTPKAEMEASVGTVSLGRETPQKFELPDTEHHR